ncbi:MAG: 50S ribosomal protein L32 [Chloroflexota bacterium]
MGALPKRKHSRSRRDRRRAHDALTPITLVKCPNCGEMHRAHHLCLNCRQYRGRQVLPPIEE